jgi:hypothetical protein
MKVKFEFEVRPEEIETVVNALLDIEFLHHQPKPEAPVYRQEGPDFPLPTDSPKQHWWQ